MTKDLRIIVLDKLKNAVTDKKGCEILYQMIADDVHTNTMLTYISMYAAVDETMLPTLLRTIEIIKDGIPDPSVN